MPHPVLDVRAVSRRYGDREAVREAGFELHAGQVACLLGPSGCGKSTLLRMIAGLEPVDDGELRIDGVTVSEPGGSVPPERRNVGLVFQDFALFPHLDVVGNIGFGLRGLDRAERIARVDALLARFHIEHLATAWPHTLSGGEQQRVAIARALARKPALLLLDEPFSGLDGHLRGQVRRALLTDLRETGTTVLIVTHDPEEAMQVADHLILMSSGRVLQSGPPRDCYAEPRSTAAARLLGDAIVVPADVRAGVVASALGRFDMPGEPDGRAELMVRPESLRLNEPGGVTARISAIRFIGAGCQVELALASESVTLLAPPDFDGQPGDSARIGVSPEQVRLFR